MNKQVRKQVDEAMKQYYEPIEYDFGLGTGYEPMAVCIAGLVVWMCIVSVCANFPDILPALASQIGL